MLFKGLVTVLAVNALLVALSIPLILRKVRRNVVYGFRTRATLADDFVWYETNAYFGRRLVAWSAVSAVVVLILYSGRTVSEQFFFPATIVAMTAPTLIALVLTLRFMRTLTPGGPTGTPPVSTPR